MFAPNMEYNINDKYLDPQGRFVILNVTINDVKLTLANIYGPNNDDDNFFLDIFENIELMGYDNRIIGGDSNCILDNNLDKRGGKPTHAHTKNTGNAETYMEETNMIDIWRTQHSTDRQFTYNSIYR